MKDLLAKKDTSKAIPMVEAYTLIGGKKSPYTNLTKDRKAFAAWIIAAAIVSSYATVSAKGAPKKATKKSQPGLMRALIGSTAWNHWHKLERFECIAAGKDEETGKPVPESVGITQKGLNEFQARMAGASKGYDTDVELVKAFAEAMVKGGKVKTPNGNVYNLDSTVAVKKV